MNRIDRLSAILIMLQSSSVVKTRQIADRFNISLRTVYRDIRALEEAGVPIAADSGHYSLVDGFKLPPLMFTQQEAFAFLAAEKLVDQFTDYGFRESYKTGIDKIRAVMRIAQKDTIENINNKIGTLNFRSEPLDGKQNMLQELMKGISDRKKVIITYLSYEKQETSDREIDPIGMFFSKSNWYLIAFCNTRKDYRTFRISRMRKIVQTEKDFEDRHPPLDSFLKNLNRSNNLHEIAIEVSKENLSLIDDSKYYQGLIEEKEDEQSVILSFSTFSLDRFARWYLSYVDIARILYPAELDAKAKTIFTDAKRNRSW